MATPETDTSRLRVTHRFSASRQRVFRAWTEPELLMRWFGETEHNFDVCEIDLRPGGSYKLAGRMGGNLRWSIWGKYLEVKPGEKLVFTWEWEHDPGPWETAGKTLVTVEFREVGKETELTLTHERFATVKARDEHGMGWKGCFDRLEKVV